MVFTILGILKRFALPCKYHIERKKACQAICTGKSMMVIECAINLSSKQSFAGGRITKYTTEIPA
jgi:hypothetical protein